MFDLLYSILCGCIRVYKWIQITIGRCFMPILLPILLPIEEKKLARTGITFNGDKPWDPQIRNDEFYLRTFVDGTLGLGETFMEGMWECEALDQLSEKFFRSGYAEKFLIRTHFFERLLFRYFNLQTTQRAWEVGVKHYDQGNDHFEAILDPYMQYTCGYWKNVDNLVDAQINKMELIAQKLMLEPGMRVLDIGCGWGGLAKYLAEKHNVNVVGCTISKEGAKYARKFCADLPVDIYLNDYRDMNEKFDRIVSVGMFEHVGPLNYPTFFEVAHRCLRDDGILLLHTMGINHPEMDQADPWLNTYAMPNSVVPRHTEIAKATTGLFIIEDLHNIGHHYSKTLMAWYENFVRAWPKLRNGTTRDEKFFRMVKFYLATGAGMFRSRRIQCWQIVLTKNGLEGGYQGAR